MKQVQEFFTGSSSTVEKKQSYSHSIVPGGLDVTSYTTLLTPLTVLQIFVETCCKNAGSNGYQSAVIPSEDVTARRATTCECVLWSP
jgi:hypothetical protein